MVDDGAVRAAAGAAEVDGVTIADWPDGPVAEPGATESGGTTVVAVAGAVVVEGNGATEGSVVTPESERPAWTTDEGPAQPTSARSAQPTTRLPILAIFRRLHLVNDLNKVTS